MMAYAAFPAASESGGMVIVVSAVSAQDGSVPDLTCDVVLCDQSARACQSYDWSPSAQRCSIGCGGEKRGRVVWGRKGEVSGNDTAPDQGVDVRDSISIKHIDTTIVVQGTPRFSLVYSTEAVSITVIIRKTWI